VQLDGPIRPDLVGEGISLRRISLPCVFCGLSDRTISFISAQHLAPRFGGLPARLSSAAASSYQEAATVASGSHRSPVARSDRLAHVPRTAPMSWTPFHITDRAA
jgi:hypothetical protein